LASLISEADAAQFAVLFPVLSKHGKDALTCLESILHETPVPQWNDPPLDPTWQSVAVEDVRLVEAAEGLIAERFAFCQTMPLDQFSGVAANLTKSGYRPIRFRPFVAQGQVLVAAVWTRDGASWQIESGTTPAGIRDRAAELRPLGYVPADVTGYFIVDPHNPNKQRTPQYAALWVQADPNELEAQAYVGVSREKDSELTDSLTKQGYHRSIHVAIPASDGRDLYCGVWTKRNAADRPSIDSDLESVAGVAPQEQRRRAPQWIADGYRPETITVAEIKGDQPLMSTLIWHRPWLGTLRSVALGKRRAGAAIAMLRSGARDEIFEALRVHDDPEALTQFVHRCRERQVTVTELLDCLHRANLLRQSKSGLERRIEDRVLFGLLLSLGEFRPDELPVADRESLIPRLIDWYAHDPSSAIHGATGWLLRHWGFDEEARKVDQMPVDYQPGREWFTLEIQPKASKKSESGRNDQSLVQPLYMTFIVFERGKYFIGSPSDETDRDSNESRHIVRITRPFAILDREVTRREIEESGVQLPDAVPFSPTPEHPMVGTNWYDAVRFCRWLGQQNGLSEEQQPYPNDKTLDAVQYPRETGPDANDAPRNWPLRLDLPGFRLPIEAEWEVACRSGMRTRYSFGGQADLIIRYAWSLDDSAEISHPPRMKRPNLRGIFDLQGNIFEWCHDWYGNYASDAIDDPLGPGEGSVRVNRGGSWRFSSAYCRSAARFRVDPWSRTDVLGMRVVLTVDAASTFPVQNRR
jgi:hypothetical protein